MIQKCGRYKAMLSFPALKNLRDRLAASAATVLRSEDKKVIDLISRLEDQMTPLTKENYDHYCEIENKIINYYYDDLQKYYVKASGKFSINRIKDDLKAYDQAYKDCEKFMNMYSEITIEAIRLHLLDQDNKDLTDDYKAHDKYEIWFKMISEFQKEIYEEIQDQVNEQMSEFRSIVELVENKLQSIEADEEDEW